MITRSLSLCMSTAFSLAAFAAGCYRSHERDRESPGILDAATADAVIVDAMRSDVRLSRDAGSTQPRDTGSAGPEDAGRDAPLLLDAAVQGPLRPTLLFPWIGFSTGSAHDEGARRPTFMWHRVEEAVAYELELAAEGVASPTTRITVADTGAARVVHRLTSPLEISFVQPVGRRYRWRVRALDADARASDWSESRYLDVGRQVRDFNGDGYADALLGAPQARNTPDMPVGLAFVYYGRSTGLPSEPSLTLNNPSVDPRTRFGVSAAALGDVNGDGYADALITGPNTGRETIEHFDEVHLYYGSLSGLPSIPSLTFAPIGHWGVLSIFDPFPVEGVGDVNGDGYADAVVGVPRNHSTDARLFLHYGSPRGMSPTPDLTIRNPLTEDGRSTNFDPGVGWAIAGVGDSDGDGYVDLAVGTSRPILPAPDSRWRGTALILRGSPSGVRAASRLLLESPADFGETWSATGIDGLGDVNRDGYADILVTAEGPGPATGGAPSVFVALHYGSSAGFPTRPSLVLAHGLDGEVRWRGIAHAGGADLNGDGFDDLLALGMTDDAEVLRVYLGSASGLSTRPQVLHTAVTAAPGANEVWALASVGDVNGDGYDDIATGLPRYGLRGEVHIYYGSGAGLTESPADVLASPAAESHSQFGAVIARLDHPPTRRGVGAGVFGVSMARFRSKYSDLRTFAHALEPC